MDAMKLMALPFSILLFSIVGCASMCGQGSWTRSMCDDRSTGNADLQQINERFNEQAAQRQRDQEAAQRQAIDQQRAAMEEMATEQRRAEVQYHLAFCTNADLFSVAFMSNAQMESGCIYAIGSAPLKVLQVSHGGILVNPSDWQLDPLHRVIFVRTKKREFVDSDLVQNIYLKSTGVLTYTTPLGTTRTVHSFEYLGDMTRAPAGQ